MTITVNIHDIDAGIGEIKTDYSGRGMYNKTCFGIVVASISELIEFVKVISDEVIYDNSTTDDANWTHPLTEFYDNISNVRQDSMGLSQIFYWPNVQVKEN